MTENSFPRAWAWTPLADLLACNNSGVWGSDVEGADKVLRVVRNGDISKNGLVSNELPVRGMTTRQVAKAALEPGDVLVTTSGDVGKCAIWPSNRPGCGISNFARRLRAGPGLEAKYLYYWLRTTSVQAQFDEAARGVTIRNLPSAVWDELRVPLASLPEQRRIVAALEEHLSDLDAAVAALERAKTNQRRYRRSVLQAVADGSLLAKVSDMQPGPDPWSPAVPSHWRFASVGDVAEAVEYGTSAKTQESTDGVPVLRMGNIVDGELSWAELKYLPASHNEFPRLLLSPGDVLFNRTNSPELVGKTAVYKTGQLQASFASYLLRVRLKPVVDPRFFSAFVNSRYGRAWVASVVSQQVGQANVNRTKLRALMVPIPPDNEQERLVGEMEMRLDSARRVVQELDTQMARAARLRQAILKRAFEGKLVPQDPNDEPTSALLTRLRETPAALSAPRQRGGRTRTTARRGGG